VNASDPTGVAPSPRPSILIVEDHRDTAWVNERLLKQVEYDALAVRTCADALVAAERKRFDLVLCDLGLTDGDGCDLFRQLRDRHGLKGIAYTGYGMPDDVARTLAAGFARHVLKPAKVPDLLAAIRDALADGNGRHPVPAGGLGGAEPTPGNPPAMA
jgi:CheY-like chemotaxis protein